MFFLRIYFCLVILLRATFCLSEEKELSSRGVAYMATDHISKDGFNEQITSSHSVDSHINCAYLCGKTSDREGACNAFSYEGMCLYKFSDGSCYDGMSLCLSL